MVSPSLYEEPIGETYDILVRFVFSGFLCLLVALLIVFWKHLYTHLSPPFYIGEGVQRKKSTVGSAARHAAGSLGVRNQIIRQ